MGEAGLRVLLQWDDEEGGGAGGGDGGEVGGGGGGGGWGAGMPVANGEATHFALLIAAERPPDLCRLDSSRRLLDFEGATSLPEIARADWQRSAADPTSSGAIGRCLCWRLVLAREQLDEGWPCYAEP